FLDAWSAGISSESVSSKISGKWFAVMTTVVGTVCAMAFPITNITDFLYLIGSVFAPMIAIQIADFFFLKKDKHQQAFCWKNLVIWLIGFLLYRGLMTVDILVGNTLPDMVLTIVLCVAVNRGEHKGKI
ncbi:MAG: putative hydroxymethylpyrimidine transporter CytX, partial [Lachnospiraceae bacterium]|nr:putative hydroxymethylpyrimidine transporter CytX [Lachnospiraceae bacterium]